MGKKRQEEKQRQDQSGKEVSNQFGKSALREDPPDLEFQVQVPCKSNQVLSLRSVQVTRLPLGAGSAGMLAPRVRVPGRRDD